MKSVKKSEMPVWLADAVQRLRMQTGKGVQILSRDDGKVYYAYLYRSRWDPSLKRPVSLKEYVGRITDGGVIHEVKKARISIQKNKIPRKIKNALAKARKRFRGRIMTFDTSSGMHLYEVENYAEPVYLGRIDSTGKFLQASATVNAGEASDRKEIDRTDIAMLKAVSTNGRITMERLSKVTGLSKGAVNNRLKRLERRYGISYLASIDVQKLGYTEYMTFVRFDDEVPSIKEINDALSPDPRVQFVAMTKGDYGMFFYFLAKNNDDALDLIYALRKLLPNYRSAWYTTPFRTYYGYLPLRDMFFDRLREENVWVRTRQEPRKPSGKLTLNQYLVLRELNSNGSIEFREIEQRNGMKPQAAQYAYRILKEKEEMLNGITVNMQDSEIKYYGVLLTQIFDNEAFLKTRKNLFMNIVKESHSLTNTYILEGDIEIPHGIAFVTPVFQDGGLELVSKEIMKKVKGMTLKSILITDIIVGRLCNRLFDNEYASQTQTLKNTYGIEIFPKNKTVYE